MSRNSRAQVSSPRRRARASQLSSQTCAQCAYSVRSGSRSVASVSRDYGMHEREQAPSDSRAFHA